MSTQRWRWMSSVSWSLPPQRKWCHRCCHRKGKPRDDGWAPRAGRWLLSGKVRKVDIFQVLFLFWYRYLEIWQLLSIVPYCTYTNREGASFSLFGLSELVCNKKVTYPIHYSLLIYPKLIPLWNVPVCLAVYFITPCSLSSFFSLSARGPTRKRNFTGLPLKNKNCFTNNKIFHRTR